MTEIIEDSPAELQPHLKNFNWKRPTCPCGCKKTWSHGFTLRIFNDCQLPVKRFRCPDCGKVFTPRLEGFWPRFQSSIAVIFQVLLSRLQSPEKRWPSNTKRQRSGHWMSRFRQVWLGHFPTDDGGSCLEKLFRAGSHFLRL
jgi:hypothetical protein